MDSSSKRGKGNDTNDDTAAAKTKKRAKGAVTKVEVEVEVGEKGKGFLAAAEEEAAAEVEELRLSWWSGVDEEMAWATCWFPFWEFETAGDAYNCFYGDVWDFDIWGFKCGHNITPNV